MSIWICDQCYNAMEEIEESVDRKHILCPVCGMEWYVDGDDEYIND